MTVSVSESIQTWGVTAIDHAQSKRFMPGDDTPCRKPDAGQIAPLRVDITSVSDTSQRQNQAILEPTRVLLLTHEPTLKTLLETVCMTHGVQMVAAALQPEREDLSLGVELTAFGLVVVDLAVFGASEWRQKRLGCRWLRTWTETYPTFPLLFIGTVSQKRALLSIRADTVRFLTRPITLYELGHAVEAFHWGKPRRPHPLPLMVDTVEQEPIEVVTHGA
ncbi:MAG: hypothetical protein OEU26_18425 [Candidatus Tectomicrobia bacterium]|nr:hypothetical protein [Candidatus Tectomicrobia bacterium]